MTTTLNIDKAKKEKIDDIISSFVSIDTDGNIIYNKRIYSIYEKTFYFIKTDWDKTEILAEAIACFYNTMLKISENYNINEINENNDDFMSEVYCKARLKTAYNLTEKTKFYKNKFISTKKNLLSEEVLNENNISSYYEDDTTIQNNFLIWFAENKNIMLTKKQLSFLEDTNTVPKYSLSKTKKNINKRTINKCVSAFNLNENFSSKEFDKKYELSILEEILNADVKNTLDVFNKHKNKDFISNILLEISPEKRKLINKNIYDLEAIKELRKKIYIEYYKKCY